MHLHIDVEGFFLSDEISLFGLFDFLLLFLFLCWVSVAVLAVHPQVYVILKAQVELAHLMQLRLF